VPVADALASLTLAALSVELGARRVSSVEATRACLAAAERAQPHLNAFIELRPETALAAAQAADREIARGERRGPLHGVPMAHKDMFYREGRVSTLGSRIGRDRPATRTATVNTRLDRAGAIELGTLNMAEFAAGPTGHNTHYGHCRNPWNTAHITGGSSSGSGCAVAGRLAYAALGSDTGGSIRLPAGICGVSGIKATNGLISRYGAMPRCWSLDVVGPLARSVEDCALVTQAIAGRDALDPGTADLPVPDYGAQLARGVKGLRIGVPVNPEFGDVHPEVRAAHTASLARFEALGARVIEVRLPDPRLVYALTNLVNKSEASTIHARWMRERAADYSLSARNRLEAGFHVPVTCYLDAMRVRAKLVAAFVESVFGVVDMVHLPLLGMPVPTVEATEIRRTAGVPELLERITRYTRWVNYLGLPSLAMPCGFDATGLPVAFQLLGRPFAEATLFRTGHAYQQATDWHLRAPPDPR